MGVVTLFAFATLLAAPPPIAWHSDLATAEAAAQASGKAMLVVFR